MSRRERPRRSSCSISGGGGGADAVGRDVLVDRDEVRRVGRAAAGAGDARLGVDDHVVGSSAQRRERQQRRRREAAGVGDEVGAARSARGAARAGRRRPRPSSSGRGCGRRTTPRRSPGRAGGSRPRGRRPCTPALEQLGDDRRGGAVRVGDDRGVDLARGGRGRAPRASAARGGAGRGRRARCRRPTRAVTARELERRVALDEARGERAGVTRTPPATRTRASATQLTAQLVAQRGDDPLADRRDVLVGQRAVGGAERRGAARATCCPRRPGRRGRRRRRSRAGEQLAAGGAHDRQHRRRPGRRRRRPPRGPGAARGKRRQVGVDRGRVGARDRAAEVDRRARRRRGRSSSGRDRGWSSPTKPSSSLARRTSRCGPGCR